MYRRPHQSREPIPLARLSLAKFSYTSTSINHGGPLNWTHIIGNSDIACTFEKYTTATPSPEKTMLRVLRDQEPLEEIDISTLVREFEGQNQPRTNGFKKQPFAVVVKLPCLAVKYPKSNAYIHRFQIKFSSDRDYYTALAILSDIKCPFSESTVNTLPAPRRQISSQWNMGSVRTTSCAQENLFLSGEIGISRSNNSIFPSHSPITPSTLVSSVKTASSLPSSSSSATAFDGTNYSVNPSLEAAPLCHDPFHSTFSEISSRPTTNIANRNSQSLDQILPPKRELPFSKPAAKRALTGAGTAGNSTKISKPNASQNIPTSDTPTQAAAAKQNPAQHATDDYPRIAQTSYMQKNTPAVETNGCPSLEQNGHVSSINESAPGIHQTLRSPGILTTADLSLYLSAPSVERTARVDNWICAHLEDDQFLQLCQDVEGIWKRVAFGK